MAGNLQDQDLSSLIMRATNPLNQDDDPNLIQAVCQEVGNDAGKIQVAVRLIVHKMQSPHEREATQALLVLQACINNCGSNFHSEVGKFRFLNEMIKLVSPKYFGNQTPVEVKRKVIELLYTWTLDLKTEPKISEAYEMLKKQGVVKEDPTYLGVQTQPPAKSQHPASFEDEKKSRLLQRLLQSRRPEDISKANALIKHMVKEDERRMERSSRRIVEVETALNNVKVLDEMLTQHKESSTAARQSDLDLMEELYNSCQTLRTNIYRIVSEMDDKEEGMGDLLKASDELSRVMGRYKLEIGGKVENTKHLPKTKLDEERDQKLEEESLLDLSPEVPPNQSESQRLELEKLGFSNLKLSNSPDLPNNESSDVKSNSLRKNELLLDELGDVFSNGSLVSPSNLHFPVEESNANLLNQDIMPPPLSPFKETHSSEATDNLPSVDKESRKPLYDIDLLGSSLLRESLPTHIDPIGSHFKAQEKVSLNEMKQKSKLTDTAPVKKENKAPIPTVLDEGLLPLPSKTSSSFQSPSEVDLLDQFLLSSKSCGDEGLKESKMNSAPINNSQSVSSVPSSKPPEDTGLPPVSGGGDLAIPAPSKQKSTSQNVQLCQVKPLNNINVSLEDIKPGKQSPVSLIEANGVSVVLHFTDNKPREDVSIIVVSVTSRNPQPISNYVLQAVGPKGCKVRLLPPSSTSLSEYSPFLPPPAITQIMLVANPNQLNVSLKVMLSYTIDDDPVSDMGEIERLPL